MAEFLFHESQCEAGSTFLRVFADDLTGAPLRIEAGNTTGKPYRFFIGLVNRSIGFSMPIDRANVNRNVPPGIQSLIDVRCDEGAIGCVSGWMCGLEGGS